MKQYERWLLKARRDLRSAIQLSSGDELLLDTAIYHTQQCAEKAIKGYLSYKQELIQKTHDLEKLVEMCILLDNDFEQLYQYVEILNPYIAEFWYPGEDMEPSLDEVKQAIDNAQAVLAFVEQKIYGKLL